MKKLLIPLLFFAVSAKAQLHATEDSKHKGVYHFTFYLTKEEIKSQLKKKPFVLTDLNSKVLFCTMVKVKKDESSDNHVTFYSRSLKPGTYMVKIAGYTDTIVKGGEIARQ